MRIQGGMVWPEDGHHGFFCVVVQKSKSREETGEPPLKYLEVTKEFTSPDLYKIFEELNSVKYLTRVCVDTDPKYYSFINEFSRWKRKNGCAIRLKTPRISSFESGVLKIKDYTTKNVIKFPEGSMVRAQLMVFSKLSLKNRIENSAAAALANVINEFDERPVSMPIEEPPISSWY